MILVLYNDNYAGYFKNNIHIIKEYIKKDDKN